MKEFNTFEVVRDRRIIAGAATLVATMAVAVGNAQSKIISATSSCTPNLGIVPPPGSECPVVEPAGADEPVVFAATHANKAIGVINYEIEVPQLGNGAKTEITLQDQSRLLELRTVGSKTVPKGREHRWYLNGITTKTGKKRYTSENISFKLSSKAHLGEKVCDNLVVAETVSKDKWKLEDDYTERECTTVAKPISHYQAAIAVNSYFSTLYHGEGTSPYIGTVRDKIGPRYLSEKGVCDATDPNNPAYSTLDVVDIPSSLTITSCVKGSDGRYAFTRIPRDKMLYPKERHVSYGKLLEELNDKSANSVGIIDDQFNRSNSISFSTARFDETFPRGKAIGSGQQLKELKINYISGSVKAEWYR
jgi:hypothetical protein